MLAALLLAFVQAPAPNAAARGPKPIVFDPLGLTLTFPAQFRGVRELDKPKPGSDELGAWNADVGKGLMSARLDKRGDLDSEPADLLLGVRAAAASGAKDERSLEVVGERIVPGPFGYVPYASILHGFARAGGATAASEYVWYVAGVARDSGYILSLYVEPPPDEGERAAISAALEKAFAYSGPVREPKWTDAEAQARWKRDVPFAGERKTGELKLVRTEHYLVLTNSSSGPAFAKQMEANYAQIRKTYPFEELPGRRLMPVFLFRTNDQYFDFYAARLKEPRASAELSKGVAYEDFYATWYEAPKDEVHIHEATHQIFDNRLELEGGGSWFQEGLAEYMCTTRNDRNEAARDVKNGKHVPLRELMKRESLLGSSTDDKSGDSAAHEAYAEAALLVEFLRESEFGKAGFLDWMHATGWVEYGDFEGVAAVAKRFYGVDVDGLDKAFQEYCVAR